MLRVLTAAALFASVAPAAADQHYFGPFAVNDDTPTIAAMIGAIQPGAPMDFRRLLAAFPGVQVIGLHSPGGDVTAALLVALDVADAGISTIIPTGQACYSACAYVFLAGATRTVSGELGVHAAALEEPHPTARVQYENDIRWVLAKFDVPYGVFDAIMNTPHADLTIYDAAAAADQGLNR